MRKFIQVTLMILGSLFILGVMAALISPEEEVVVDPAPQTVSKRDTLGNSFKEGYMEGCLDGDEVSYSYCSCTYDYLDDNYTNEEVFEAADYIDATGNTPDMLLRAAIYCSDYLE